MLVVIFTPCVYYGGLDVAHASIVRQETDAELLWVIGDELYKHRHKEVAKKCTVPYIHFDTSAYKKKDDYRTLAQAYNFALSLARDRDAEMMISLQDYIAAPIDGVQKFLVQAEFYPNALLSGLTSIAAEPTADLITNRRGGWSVFAEPYEEIPQRIHWADVRERSYIEYRSAPPIEWEANWAAIPQAPLYDTKLEYDESYDKGCAYENQGYSFLGTRLGYPTSVDQTNHAISLPHKRYFPEREAEDLKHLNDKFHAEKWNDLSWT